MNVASVIRNPGPALGRSFERWFGPTEALLMRLCWDFEICSPLTRHTCAPESFPFYNSRIVVICRGGAADLIAPANQEQFPPCFFMTGRTLYPVAVVSASLDRSREKKPPAKSAGGSWVW